MGEQQACRLGSKHAHKYVQPTSLARCVHHLEGPLRTCPIHAQQPQYLTCEHLTWSLCPLLWLPLACCAKASAVALHSQQLPLETVLCLMITL